MSSPPPPYEYTYVFAPPSGSTHGNGINYTVLIVAGVIISLFIGLAVTISLWCRQCGKAQGRKMCGSCAGENKPDGNDIESGPKKEEQPEPEKKEQPEPEKKEQPEPEKKEQPELKKEEPVEEDKIEEVGGEAGPSNTDAASSSFRGPGMYHDGPTVTYGAGPVYYGGAGMPFGEGQMYYGGAGMPFGEGRMFYGSGYIV